MNYLGIILMALFIAGCQQGPHHKQGKLEKGMAKISALTPKSKVSGTVDFVETPEGLRVSAELHGLTPGKHGFHVHEYGDISNEGNAAGAHYNPNDTKHGYVETEGFHHAHAGDLGNIVADAKGDAILDLFVPGLFLSGGKYNIAGRALIVHEKEDDFSQPAGNAGARFGGGAIIFVK